MAPDSTIDRLQRVFRQTQQGQAGIDPAAITLQTRIEDLGFDSLTLLDLVYDLQQEFKIDDDIRVLANLKSVGDLVAYLEANESA